MKVNIVMLAHNREKLTRQTLLTLYKNTPKEMFNLTFIDDGSDQSQSVTVPAAGSENSCTLRIEDSKNITGQARNLGVYFAEKYWGRGDYLYLMDNDTFATPQWLSKLIAAFGPAERDHKVKLLGGWNHPYLQPHPCMPVGAFYGAPTFDYGVLNYCTHDAVSGASQLMRWETWDKFGDLDAHAKGVGQSEDFAFCQKIIKAGGRVASLYPRCVYNAGLTNSFGQPSPGADVMLKELQEAKKLYPDLYWE
jgi:GT2 family glycosyltransferase